MRSNQIYIGIYIKRELIDPSISDLGWVSSGDLHSLVPIVSETILYTWNLLWEKSYSHTAMA